MTAIRSLADELREKMRRQSPEEPAAGPESPAVDNDGPDKKPGRKKAGKPPPDKVPAEIEILFGELNTYKLTGDEKLLIRLESRTVFMLKQLKIAKGVDMNKLIAYSLDAFFRERPELINYIKASLQNIQL